MSRRKLNKRCELWWTNGLPSGADHRRHRARRVMTSPPDATLAIADRMMPGFGEQMRQISLPLCAS